MGNDDSQTQEIARNLNGDVQRAVQNCQDLCPIIAHRENSGNTGNSRGFSLSHAVGISWREAGVKAIAIRLRSDCDYSITKNPNRKKNGQLKQPTPSQNPHKKKIINCPC
jgi:hypothetical protein